MLTALGEALIIAFVLALIVDPLMQHKLVVDWGRDLYWAIFSPDAPQEFKAALQEAAAPSAYIRRCTYTLRLNRIDNFVEADLVVREDGDVLDRGGYRPRDKVFIFAGSDGRPSRYKSWSFECPDDLANSIELNASDLHGLGALSVEVTGRTVLDQSKIANMGVVPFRSRYELERGVETTRRTSDFLTLFRTKVVLEQVVVIRGDALKTLDVSVSHLAEAQLEFEEEITPAGERVLKYSTRHVTFPGQASVVHWHPKEGAP
ncbi:hypothetical protein [Actinomycetospora lemnae]|uniref:DUF2993 domain-containing protein n=1 Tax=Actinomycetospora lemnae TaxID=3019891 RepID=A0ABT5SXV9_9PSEU|nr:hypothetical protein [Actinomycetospora sp. DW7H6]MDD7967295.1 hypothetical protein [Actinomycetospora sp. DW7H6]